MDKIIQVHLGFFILLPVLFFLPPSFAGKFCKDTLLLAKGAKSTESADVAVKLQPTLPDGLAKRHKAN